MSDETTKILSEYSLKLAQSHSALIDILSIICLHLANENPKSVENIKNSLKNLRDQQQFETNDAFVHLADVFYSALSQDLDAPIHSLKLKSENPLSPEELRASFRLILGGQS